VAQFKDRKERKGRVKLIIQIPCFNEEETLGITLSGLPKSLEGIDAIEWLVIDDGSTDRTVEVARQHGVDHVVSFPKNRGLARAFMAGLDACVREGADIIVNIDADNQYAASDIPLLIGPILAGRAEFVVGTRPISEMQHFSRTKKIFQKMGSLVVRLASRTDVQDAPSGFRAIKREAAMRLKVFDEYTYTLETLIQAGQKDMAITSVPVRTNKPLRPSRLIKSVPGYIARSSMTIIRIFMTYKPFKFFAVPGLISFCLGLILFLRFLFFYFSGRGSGHVQSVILAALLLGSGFFLMVIGLLADLVSVNRKLLENLDWRVQGMEEYMKEGKEKRRGPS
jgi:glycosyltransferase involved in cell wall biosynthesis